MVAERMMLVGEAWGAEEAVAGRPFVGSSGKFLRAMLHECKIKQPIFTNVFNLRPPQNDVQHMLTTSKIFAANLGLPPLVSGRKKQFILAKYEEEVLRLREEIRLTNPDVVVALGGTALYALTGVSGIMSNRGYPYFFEKWRVYGTVHPAAVLRQYAWKTLLLMDLLKAKESAPIQERVIFVPETVEEYERELNTYYLCAPWVACDAETRDSQITVFGFAATPTAALVVPIWLQRGGSYWQTLEEEVEVWELTRKVFERVPMVGQNYQYDISYFWRKYGIAPKKWLGDTMLQHHSLQPEMQKSLGFLGSAYAEVPGWKHLRKEDDKELDWSKGQ